MRARSISRVASRLPRWPLLRTARASLALCPGGSLLRLSGLAGSGRWYVAVLKRGSGDQSVRDSPRAVEFDRTVFAGLGKPLEHGVNRRERVFVFVEIEADRLQPIPYLHGRHRPAGASQHEPAGVRQTKRDARHEAAESRQCADALLQFGERLFERGPFGVCALVFNERRIERPHGRFLRHTRNYIMSSLCQKTASSSSNSKFELLTFHRNWRSVRDMSSPLTMTRSQA